MTPEGHRDKANRIDRSLDRCTPPDYEAIIEGSMLAASHWINLALHTLGLSPSDKDFMHPYFVTDGDRRTYDQALGSEMLRAFEKIEELRPFYVRGADPGGARAGQRALELLASIRQKALAITSGG